MVTVHIDKKSLNLYNKEIQIKGAKNGKSIKEESS